MSNWVTAGLFVGLFLGGICLREAVSWLLADDPTAIDNTENEP